MLLNPEFTEKLIRKYERRVAPFTFIIGFLFDTLTLSRIDLWIDHLVIILYLALAGLGIIIFNFYENGSLRFRPLDAVFAFIPVVIQFAFGGLFSAFVIFYTKSLTFAKSWFFLLILVALLIGNERFRRRYQRFVFQVSIYFIAVFSYFVFLFPILFRKIGADIFIISGLAALGFIAFFLSFFSYFVPAQIKKGRKGLMASVAVIYAVFNIFYFANIIPPIPLSLKESGIYHSVQRVDEEEYAVSYEKAPLYTPFQDTNWIYHYRPDERVYYFTSVFAPTKFNIPVLHQWSHYSQKEKKWIIQNRIKFNIFGGRDGGYRGYSYKTAIEPGKWRGEKNTEGGQDN